MAQCATCGHKFLKGIKDPETDLRYCTATCRFNDFLAKFEATLALALIENPDPLPPLPSTPKSVTKTVDEFDSLMAADSSIVVDSAKDVLIAGLGIVVSLAVAALIQVIFSVVKYPFFDLTFLFVIPLGAYFCGMLAGIGFWLTLRKLDRRPTWLIWLSAVIAGIISYVLIYFLIWWNLEFDGQRARDHTQFVNFFQIALANQAIQIGHGVGKPIELGKVGYARFVINYVGFILGVVSMVAIAGGKEYCPKCRRYYKNVGTQIRSSSNPEATALALHPVIQAMRFSRIQDALILHAESGTPGKNGYWTSTILVEACPGCATHKAKLTASVPGEQGPSVVPGFSFEAKTNESVSLPDVNSL